MNSYERVMAVLSGETPDRVPVIPLIREWPARQLGWTLSDVLSSVEKHVFSQVRLALELDYDCVYDLNAINAEAQALGSVLKDDDISVTRYAIEDFDRDWKKLKLFDPYKDGRLPMILEGVRRLKEIAGFQKVVIGYMQSPFRLASMLRGPERILVDCLRQPDKVTALLDFCTHCQVLYGMALVRAGADIIDISDPLASGDLVSKELAYEFSFRHSATLIGFLKRVGAMVSYHVCGDTTDRLDMLAGLGADVLSLDHKVDLKVARERLGDRVLLGNVDPELLLSGSPKEVGAVSRKCIQDAGREGRFILSSGCLIPADAPFENVRAMVDAARNHMYRT